MHLRRTRPTSRAGRLHLARKSAFALLCLLLFAVLLEAAVRLWLPPLPHLRLSSLANSSTYVRLPNVPYGLRPALSYGDRFWTNQFGMAYTPELSLAKPPGTIRVLTLGGSAMQGLPGSEQESPAAHLRRQLAARVPDLSIEVLNGAVVGYSSIESYHALCSRLILFAPDLVILYHCWNELSYHWNCSPERMLMWGDLGEETRETRVWRAVLQSSSHTWRYLARAWHRTGAVAGGAAEAPAELPEPGVSEYGMAVTRRHFRLIRDFCAQEGIVFYLCKQALYCGEGMTEDQLARCQFADHTLGVRSHLDTIARIYRLCDELAAPARVIDCTAGINGTDEYFTDAVHLTARGAEAVAARIADALVPALEARARSSRSD